MSLATWRSRPRPSLASALVLAALLGAAPSAAQTDQQRAGARAAATAGAEAFKAGKWADAIDLFSRAESLVHAPPHLLYLARAHSKLGHLVEAQELYYKITKETLAPNAPKAFKDAQTDAANELKALEPRVPSLTVSVSGPGASAAKVFVDGQELPAALVGVPGPANPGKHEIRVEVAGRAPVTSTVDVKEAGREVAKLTVEAPVESAAPVPTAAAPTSSASATLEPPAVPKSRVPAYVALGIGAVGLGVGTLFLIQRGSSVSEQEDLCTGPGGACPDSRKGQISSLDDDISRQGLFSVVGFGVGVVGVAAGVTLLLTQRPAPPSDQGARVVPWIGAGSAGLSGTF